MPTLAQPEGLPASIHTEVAILGAMMLDPVAVNDAAVLRAEDFSLDSHQRIFRVISDLSAQNRGIDYTTVRAELERRKEIEAIGGSGYLASVTEGIPRNLNLESYIRIVKDKSLLRRVMAWGHEAINRAQEHGEDALTLVSDLESALLEISGSATKADLVNIPQIVKESFPNVDTLYETRNRITGLPTHYYEFDRMTSGLQASELIIIAARPSMGKSSLAMNIAQNAAHDGKVVAVFSLEMSRENLLKRLVAGSDKYAIMRTLERLMESHLHIDDTPGITLSEMRAKTRRLKQRKGLDLVVVDYLQLMESGKRKVENRTQEVSAISRGLKALAKELQVPVVALSQLSRGNEQRTDKRPYLSDLRESGSIEQDADVVAFIHREEYYDRTNDDVKGRAEVIVAKQRNGPTGTIHLAWIAEMTRFENLARENHHG